MLVKRNYTKEGMDLITPLALEKRQVQIKDNQGKLIYDVGGLEFPKLWSQLASKVVASKYFFKGDNKEYLEKSVVDMLYRVDDEITLQAVKQGILSEDESKIFRDELFYMGSNQLHSFNSPVWFNYGLNKKYGIKEKVENFSQWAVDEQGNFSNVIDAYERPQTSACFIQAIKDNMSSILDHEKKEGMLFKFGSGTGTNFSVLRAINEPLSGGGIASGSISFMRIYDVTAGRIQSGGKTRRAAKMVILGVNHPDIYRFVYWKVNEERKALWLSSNPYWAPKSAGDLESEAYKTVDGQNGNNSVRVTDEFMKAAEAGRDWDLLFITGNRYPTEEEIPLSEYKDDRYLSDKRFVKKLTNKRKVVNAGELLEYITRGAAAVGDPAIQYDDTINKWNTCKNFGRINASNPCSEFMAPDDTACNLASLRLTKYSNDRILNIDSFKQAVSYSIIAQETLVDASSYPSIEIAENSHKLRPLGLGYTDLGALLMEKGIAYDSEEGRVIASVVTSLMTAQAYKTSIELAKKIGPFKEFENNKDCMIEVLKMHQDADRKIKRIKDIPGLEEILRETEKLWEENVTEAPKYGVRNSQVTLLAPTGTIGFMMDVDCTGIEPMPALQSTKGLAGGGRLEIELKQCVTRGLKSLGYQNEKLEKIIDYIKNEGTVVGAPNLKEEHYKVFATALERTTNAIHVDGHLNMMAAVQPFLSGAISKTVNLPKGSTTKDVKDTYIKGWKLGLKSVSLYVDGSKGIQPINIKSKREEEGLKWGDRDKPINSMLLGGCTDSGTWNFKIGNTGIFLTIQEYDNKPPKDSPAAIFVLFGSSGSPYVSTYTSWGKESSRNRQRGEPVIEFVEHNIGASGNVNGLTTNPFIKKCTSIEDMTAKIIKLEYLGDTSVCDVQPTPEQIRELRCNVLARRRRDRHFQSRIDYIDSIMEKGEIKEVFPLFEDKPSQGKLSSTDIYCIKCGAVTEPSGANCRKCNNCGESPGCG